MTYTFDVEEAKKFGVEEAILIQNFRFWILKNKANEKHFYDGRTWTYNTQKALAELFPFWTIKQIKRIIGSLIKQRVLIIGNYNKIQYDRTLWYAFENENEMLQKNNCPISNETMEDAQMGQSIIPNGTMENPKWDNGKSQMGRPIPDINTDINTDNNKLCSNAKNAFKQNAKQKNVVVFNEETNEFDVPSDLWDVWYEAYQLIDPQTEVDKAAAWVLSNPTRKKKDWARFLNNWLTKAHDKAERIKAYKEAIR